MNKDIFKKFDGTPAAIIGAVVLVGIAGYGFYTYRNFEGERAWLLTELTAAQDWNYELLLDVREKERIVDSFSSQLEELGVTVGVLDKLAHTDEELLKKYSKVYFLNENYIPATLFDIDEKYLLPGSKNFMIYGKVWPHLRDLLEAAHSAGQNLLIASAYRSFGTQSALKSAYTVSYGSGANRFSADQGYSEHQLGTAVDFTTNKLGTGFSAFASEPAYKWLQENAHKYGFILSYPKNNAYYQYEPWHWRYVGIELATKLHDENKFFYDLDQREIDKYLVNLFD
ncbi:MAG: hypothetical protein A3J09_01545 [Candidatus Zambryskibacteria bacterium RIFCSPLOWO2_02_FULL_51_21]|uniref:D-alanyl-D-alanine carboxypeptidase-like core domain-containing protein n=1 Tax=Candidatus Zambryskibacteria bacterium RIFCSPHIGHO2_02_FULL_43_37 TaxID=1802749 RepID=A0A1G2TGT3_9BACT|nr:MAG: hypothetical protein A2723_01545 [Candidatus Zambryskibacteria bacterium RIFCSPHIGHO2_01_FULL_52_18]OHA96506.1 MAG: hypothetical protein A3D49_01355 [Candidatus Zambryskibacteria bacterium RIFCSPHIGHO2_02_FULL_43_37]OHB07176.1 MAG: hypothetical protein A2944_01120 [Candidatus Zambryskibacteria bacterium RIFCSPLOWO2_01_FULL_52_12]OHB11230.1 MAG: hypothetical protein A3J09_01545 [Candidatus Zambryskibacteria bacterium RIFCSPLOWO2_02_FULL_51_21]